MSLAQAQAQARFKGNDSTSHVERTQRTRQDDVEDHATVSAPNNSRTRQPRQYRKKGKNLEWAAVSQASSAKQVGLQFISETGTHRPDGTTRNLIRSHARRKQPQAQVHATTKKNTLPADVGGELIRRTENSPLLTLPLGPEWFDPFNTLPAPLKKQSHELVYHYDQTFRHTYTPLHPREKWLPIAFTDPVLMQATLFISAMSRSAYRGQISFGQDVFYHAGQTVTLLKERLANSKTPASNATIMAVGCLIQLENLGATSAGARIHLNGLEAMVNARGGLQCLSGFAKSLSLWVDNSSSILLEEAPRWDMVALGFPKPVVERPPYSLLVTSLKSKLVNLTGLPELAEETIDLCWTLRTISMTKETVTNGLVKQPDSEAFNDILNYLERRVILITISKAVPAGCQQTSIFYLISNALILHVLMFLRDQTRGLPLLFILSGRIRNRLEHLDIQMLQYQYPEIMLWIYIMGGLGSGNKDNRSWFAARLADACQAAGLHGGSDIALALKDFMWLKLYRSPVTNRFWRDVTTAEGVEFGYETSRLSDNIAALSFNFSYSDPEDPEFASSSPNNTPSPSAESSTIHRATRQLPESQSTGVTPPVSPLRNQSYIINS